MSRRPLSDQRHLLVELELDESVLGDSRRQQTWYEPHGSPHEASQSRRPSDRSARPQSATVRRTSASDHKNSSPFKLKQKVLSSRSRAALDVEERSSYSQSRRTSSSSTSRRRDEPAASTPLTLIADAIRQNIMQRHQVLMQIQDELHRASALPQTRRVGHQQAVLLSSSIIKALNRLRSLTLSIVEMVRYFHEQLPTGNSEGDATLWALRHEFQDCFTRLCSSDVDCLLSFPPVVYLFESLGANALRNPMLDGVSLDSSELLLCSCQSTGSTSNVTSSSLFRLIVSRLEAFAIQVRQVYPSWQVLPHDRVARALLDLLECETKANATRLLPSYLRSERDNPSRPYNRRFDGPRVHYPDENEKTSSGRRPQYAAASASQLSHEDEDDDDFQEEQSEGWEDTQQHTQAKKPSQVWVDAPSMRPSETVSKVATSPTIEPMAVEWPLEKAPAASNIPGHPLASSPLVAEPKVSPLEFPATSSTPRAAKKAKKLHERAMTVNSLSLFPPPRRTSETHPTSEAKQTVVELLHAAEKKRDSDDDRLRATIASALDKLPQFSLDPLGITRKTEVPVTAVASPHPSARAKEDIYQREEAHMQEAIQTHQELPTVQPLLVFDSEKSWESPPFERVEEDREVGHDAHEAVDSENASALSRILSLCRDVQVAAIDMNQRLDQSRVDLAKRSNALAPLATVSPAASPRYHLSSRYLERELKMLRRCFRLWQTARVHRRERLQALRVASAARRIGRFAKWVLARKLATQQLTERQRKERLAVRIQRQWRVFLSRKQVRRRQQAFHLTHRCFKRYRFFTRLMQRHRKRLEAQRTLQSWWRRLDAAKKDEERRIREEEQLKCRQVQAAKQLQGFVKEQMLRSKLAKALQENRSFMMKEKLKQTRARQEDEKRLKLESKRRAEMRAVMQQSLREMENRWKEAEAAKALLQEETVKRQEVEKLQGAKMAKDLARARIDRFLERTVLRRRLLEATRATEEIARAKYELELVRERLERRQREDQTKHLLQERMLWWKLNKSVAKERSVGQRKLQEMETRRRAEQAAMNEKIHAQTLKAVAQKNVAELFGTVTGDVVEQTYQARLRSKRKEARKLRKRAAQERIAGFVWQCWTNHVLQKTKQAVSDIKRQQQETEERERVEREARVLAEATERRAVSMRQIVSWLTQQLARRKEKQRREEEAARVEAERARERLRLELEQRDLQRKELEAAVERERLRLEVVTKQLEQQREEERETEQLVRVQLVQVMMETQKTVDKAAATALTGALVEYADRYEQFQLAARIRGFFLRLLVRKVAKLWRQFVLRRHATKGITTEALWPMEWHRSSRMVVSQLMENADVVLEIDQARALRLFELKCITSARKVQRCWRAWNRQLRRRRRLQAKAEEDALVELVKGGVKAVAPTQEALDNARHTLQRWLRSQLRNKRLTWPVMTAEGSPFFVCFGRGHAWVRSLSTTDNNRKTRVRFDRGVTRKLLVATEPAVHSQNDLMKLFHTLVSDVQSIVTRATTSPRALETPDGWLEIGDVDEMELPQFCQVTRQLTKTRSMFKRQQLLDAKAASSSDRSTASSSTCLTIFDAVESASVDDAQFLLQQGADLHVREPCHQRTALHVLAFSTEPLTQRLLMLHFLIERAKLDVNARDNAGDTPLMLFAAQGCVGLVDAMLEFTPHWWRETTTHSNAKHLNTAMHRACERDQPEVAVALQHHGLKHETSLERQRELLVELHRSDAAGMSPLHILASRGHIECIRELLTPLDAASRSLLLGAYDARRGCTPLHFAIEHSQVDAARVLLEMGADIHASDAWQCSPVHFACRSPHAEELIALLTETTSVDWQLADERGDTALHWAAASGRAQVVRQLLVLGADPTVLNNDWETPAQVAAVRGHSECLRLLLPASGHSTDVSLSLLAHAPVRDLTQELPSPKSYCHPQKGMANARKKGEYDWDEIHKDVQLVEESGHFSSEDEGDGDEAKAPWDSDDAGG